jgi:preprotein translocase subunit SecG
MTNRSLILITLVLLAGIFLVLIMQTSDKADNRSIGGSVDEVVEEVQDEIDDQTTGQ